MRRVSGVDMAAAKEDRLQRALQENHQLKHRVNELQEKLKRVQVQFQKLTSDMRRLGPEALVGNIEIPPKNATALPALRPSTSGAASEKPRAPIKRQSMSSSHLLAVHPNSSLADTAELRRYKEALQRAELEIATLHATLQQNEHTQPSASSPPVSSVSPVVTHVLEQLRRDLAVCSADRDAAREALARSRAELDAVRLAQQHHQTFESHSFDVLNERVAISDVARRRAESESQRAIDALTRERDALALKLRLAEVAMAERPADGLAGVDPIGLVELQRDAADKSRQIAILTSRLHGAQQQAETLKGECARLVEELKRFHAMHGETKRDLFESEHARTLLQVRCARVEELEGSLQRKSEELLRAEGELLRTVGTLQSCSRETEEAVRRELADRIADLQELRDAAEAQRRSKESQLLTTQRDALDLKRQLESARGDVQMYREELQKAREESTRVAASAVVAGHTAAELSEEEVRRALAVAALRRRGSSSGRPKTGTNDSQINRHGAAGGALVAATDEADEALALWDTLQWDDAWEADQLREALASAALDMELASQRTLQMSEQVEQGRTLLQAMSGERDTLLEENMELRRRLTQVQTVFAKQQLEVYRATKERGVAMAHGSTGGTISFCLRDVTRGEGLSRALGDEPAVLFFSLDGLRAFDTMLSPTFYGLDEPLDIRFRYEHLDCDEVTVSEVQRTTFVLQLHQARGSTNVLLAMGELPGAALLASRGMPTTERVELLCGDGASAGAVMLEVCAAGLMLPVLLGRPLESPALSAEAMRAALLALRSVAALRVQVFRADGLKAEPTPQPYVFYTASSSAGMGFLRDTVVKTSTKSFTSDPVFDVEPVDHRLVVDKELLDFVAEGSIVFVVFDERAKEVQANLGVAEVSLRPLLASPQAVIRTTEALHPQGTLSIGISWVTRA